jgi:hypothetical protein
MFDKPNTAEPQKPRRRRLQFMLRTLLVIVTLLAIPCAYLGWQANIVAHRRLVLKNAMEQGLVVMSDDSDADAVATVPWIRRIMGDAPVRSAWWVGATKEDRARFKEAFPEAKVQHAW